METLAADRVLGGRYRLRRELARGGMAMVWEAEDRVLSRRVAIKVLHPHLANDDKFRIRFRREAVAAAALVHPHIVTTYDTGRDSAGPYIVMELVDGITLARLLQSTGLLPPAKAVDIAAQVADALACAHARGVIHRDVKPANILLRSDGHVKVADFGIAKAGGGNDLTRTGIIMGTAKYLSPEQVGGDPADAGSDIYALGVVLYEMLAGQPPFVGDTEISTAVARLTASPPSLRQLRPELPHSLEAIVLRSLARDPNLRFSSAGALRASLLAVDLSGSEPATPPAGFGLAAPPPRRSRARVATAVATAGILAASIVLVKVDGTKPRAARSQVTAAPHQDGVAGPVPVKVVAFDPQGDNQENSPTAPNLIDGDTTTLWKTERYTTARFGGLKSGVGVYLDLGASRSIRSVEVVTPDQSDWTGEIYLSDADRAPANLPQWGTTQAKGRSPFRLNGAPARYVLVWITTLPPADGGYRLEVGEIKVS